MVLVRVVGLRQEVVLGCALARAAGVQPGMTLAHARALLGRRGLRVVDHDPAGDAAALRALAGWATRLLPVVEPDADAAEPPGRAMPGLAADVTGCDRLYGGEPNLLAQVLAAVRGLGLTARVAVGPTLGCAWAAARFGASDPAIIGPGEAAEAVAALPVRGLRVGQAAERALDEVGVQSIGEVAALPRASLAARFGPGLVRRLDAALGRAHEPLAGVRPRGLVAAARAFDGPVRSLEAVSAAAHAATRELCDRLAQAQRGAGAVELVLERSDCEPYRLPLRLSGLCRDPGHLWALLRPGVEAAHLGYGVESVTLRAYRVGPLAPAQRSSAAMGAAAGQQAADLELRRARTIDALRSRLGGEAVRRAELLSAHQPERAARDVAVHADEPGERGAPTGGRPTRAGSPAASNSTAAGEPDRPSVLLRRPHAIAVMAVTPDGPVARFTWRGEAVAVVTTIGPERLTPPWWRPDPHPHATRDYFKVQDDRGRWWWLYRELETRRWYVHGRWA